jgi:hypothetical protein
VNGPGHIGVPPGPSGYQRQPTDCRIAAGGMSPGAVMILAVAPVFPRAVNGRCRSQGLSAWWSAGVSPGTVHWPPWCDYTATSSRVSTLGSSPTTAAELGTVVCERAACSTRVIALHGRQQSNPLGPGLAQPGESSRAWCGSGGSAVLTKLVSGS